MHIAQTKGLFIIAEINFEIPEDGGEDVVTSVKKCMHIGENIFLVSALFSNVIVHLK